MKYKRNGFCGIKDEDGKVFWSKKHSKCIACGTVADFHQAKGFCRSCYRKYYKHRDPEKYLKNKRDFYYRNAEKINEKKRAVRPARKIKTPEEKRKDHNKRSNQFYHKHKDRIRKKRILKKEFLKKLEENTGLIYIHLGRKYNAPMKKIRIGGISERKFIEWKKKLEKYITK